MKKSQFTILGVGAGIGSPMVGAKAQGYEVIGNIESRPVYYLEDYEGRNTFRTNFNAPLVRTDCQEIGDRLTISRQLTVIAGHPKCGAYSNLVNNTGESRRALRQKKSSQFLEFVQLVNNYKPKFFFLDNLPKFLVANPISGIVEMLPDYKIELAWVSNADYGNCQWHRNRLFIIGSNRRLGYSFMPYPSSTRRTTESVIGDLLNSSRVFDDDFNHVKHTLQGSCKGGYRLLHDGPMDWAEAREYFKQQAAKGLFDPMHYPQKETGEIKHHFGYCRVKWRSGCKTLTGITPKIHPIRHLPLSPRERARIMGFPDDFKFYGIKYEPDGTWRHHNNIPLMRQTGNCIPVEFPTFLTGQFQRFLIDPDECRDYYSGPQASILKPNPIIEEAKQWLRKK